MKRFGKKALRRGCLCIGSLILAAVFFLSPMLGGSHVSAVSSLPYVEEIIAAKSVYHVLELVPEQNTGCIGYYIEGNEPCKNWRIVLSAIRNTDVPNRTDAANAMFRSLASAGILGGGSAAPLKYTYFESSGNRYYTEKPLWELGSDLTGWSKLALLHDETASVKGYFTPAEGGAYRQLFTYRIAHNGGYAQDISFVAYKSFDPGDGYYYYAPNAAAWQKIEALTDLGPLLGKYAYTRDESGHYIAAGILGQTELDVNTEYFWLNTSLLGIPRETYGPADYCYAVPKSAGWRTEDGGNFSRELSGYDLVGTGGDYLFTPDPARDLQTIRYREIYYKGGYTNNQWFLSGVFDLSLPEDAGELRGDLTSVTPDQVTAAMISNADLIVISAGFIPTGGAAANYTDSCDLPDALAYMLAVRLTSEWPAVIDSRAASGPADSNVRKLARFALGGAVLGTAADFDAIDVSRWNTQGSVYASDADKNFVNKNIYCFTPDAAASAFASPSFLSGFPDAKTAAGFTDALKEITDENFYRQVAGLPPDEMLDSYVSMATATRYIVNYMGKRGANTIRHVRVLDIEPSGVKSGALTENDVRTWLGNPTYTDEHGTAKPVTVSITSITSGEFIGKIEDINECCDLIYLGDNVSGMNTVSGETVYNDESMNRLIYSNVGDQYRSGIHLTGLLDRDYTDASCEVVYNGSDTEANLFRFSGNDITGGKADALIQFAAAGYPVVVGNKLLTAGGAVDQAHVDSSSNLYTALNTIKSSANVLRQNSVTPGTLLRYLKVSKPSIALTVQPVVYVDSDPAAVLTEAADGNYYLNYQFEIDNVTEPTPRSTAYDVRLYLDLNADGRFSSEEQLPDIEVSDSRGTAVLPASDNTYHLCADIAYTVQRQMPVDYVGIIPWKLEVVKNGASQVHASVINYTRIAAETKQDLHILQISKSGAGTQLINLENQLTSGTVFYKNQNGTTASAQYRGIYGALIGRLSDFDIHILTVEADDLERMENLYYYDVHGAKIPYNKPPSVNADSIYSYLDNFNMLIIGFADMYGEIGSNGAPAITRYIDSRRSVLFTHDTTSFSNVPSKNFPTSTARGVATEVPLSTWTARDNAAVTPPNATDTLTAAFSGNRQTGGGVRQKSYLDWGGWEWDKRERKPIWRRYIYTLSATISNFTDGSNVTIGIEDTTYSTGITGNGLITLSDIQIESEGDYIVYIEGSDGSMTASNVTLKRTYSDINYLSNSSWRSYDNAQFTRSYSSLNIYFYTEKSGGRIYQQKSLTAGAYQLTATVTSLSRDASDIILGVESSSGSSISRRSLTSAGQVSISFTLSSSRSVVLYVSGARGSVSLSDIKLLKQPSTGSNGTLGSDWWGYYFNTVIRDAVGLDRYGVTNTLLRPYLKTGDGDSLLSTQSLSTDVRAALNRHDLAYVPCGARNHTVPEAQGFNNYELIRYGASGDRKYTNNTYTTRETSTVSQVNKGQITTYPYNVNTEAFGGTDRSLFGVRSTPYMSVGLTHEQYYQVNMSTDDIVVWYCLSSGGGTNYYYNDIPNDVTNAYYIYSKGNVTYSGVGHTEKQNLYTSDNGTDIVESKYVNEAKLFVNTMIAAFQSGMQSPSISFRDSDSPVSADQNVKYFALEYNDSQSNPLETLLAGEDGMDASHENRALYFKISDPNLSVENKSMAVQYFYVDPDSGAVTEFTPENAPASARGGIIYRILLPADSGPLRKLASRNVSMVTVRIKVITSINGQSPHEGTDEIQLRKIGLFNLN